ncbi:hypothetical protein EBI_23711 [Enterocytozoon bieneusi H348]|nr:hypothetical protein EBI_23711 [Enterocytozoon bieneusi H348]|eukprot:XP_002650216.1 hypothetical protein EBI_23711 [Enterocytozoon bieneusi H348]
MVSQEKILLKLLELDIFDIKKKIEIICKHLKLDFLEDNNCIFISNYFFVIEIINTYQLHFTFVNEAYKIDYWYIEDYFKYNLICLKTFYYLLKYFVLSFENNINNITSIQSNVKNGFCCECIFTNNYCKIGQKKDINFFTHRKDNIIISNNRLLTIDNNVVISNLYNVYFPKYINITLFTILSKFNIENIYFDDGCLSIYNNKVSINVKKNKILTYLFYKNLNINDLYKFYKEIK